MALEQGQVNTVRIATLDVVGSAEWKQARQSDWTSRLQPQFRNHLRLVCRRYVRGGAMAQ